MTSDAARKTSTKDDPTRAALLVGALGVVFGDIGTSPIYAFRQSLKEAAAPGTDATVLGLLSLIFWAVVLVVAIKYVVLVMRADSQGEGGTMALLSIALPRCERSHDLVLYVGLAGAALFFGDAMITPAISVLSAVEGTVIVAPRVTPWVVPIAAGILVALFAVQSRGSGRVGRLFGPVMVVWFTMIAVAGFIAILSRPAVLAALDPRHAIAYLAHAPGWSALIGLGSVFLALTGAEALYADMGHFGRKPIRVDWFVVVMPALVLNYFGQGAMVLDDPSKASNPFFLMFPPSLLWPVVVVATAATIIASQAVISGAFTLVQQAMQLGALPRLDVRQTSGDDDSSEAGGQIYIARINWLLAAAVFGLVVGFRSSDALANAYGMAVSGNMLVTTLLIAIVARGVWRWSWFAVVPVIGVFVVLDLAFVAANAHKIPGGGWFPLGIGAVILTMMICWRRGRAVAMEKHAARSIPLDRFIAELPDKTPRVDGTAIYLTQFDHIVPEPLTLNLKHYHVLHRQVVLLRVKTERVPRVEGARVVVRPLGDGFRHVEIAFGFAEKPDVPAALAACHELVDFDPAEASYFLGREIPVPSLHPELPRWQERVYALMTRSAVRAPDYFAIPPAQVVELGTRIEM